LSARLSVLRHVRDAMAESQDKQKEQADAKGRGNVESYEVGDLVLLNAKNLPTHAVSAVFKTKLRPRFVGPFTVVAKKGLAYTLNLPKKMRTHPVFYVGLLKPYHDPSHVSSDELAPRVRQSQDLAVPEATQPSLEENSTPSGRSRAQHRPPAALLDEQGDLHYHVERLLARRRCQGQNQYLVKWRGYPHSQNSWEFEVPLRQDCPDVVDAFDRLDHQQRQGLRPRERSNRASH
jgi:hypothetical protein